MILREYILQLPLDPAMNDGKTRLFPESDFTQLIVLPKAGSRLEFIARDKSLSAVESCAAVAAAV